MRLLDRARLIGRSAAFEVSRRYSERNWKHQFVKQLESHQVDVVLDVGANSGQYAADLRKAAYKGRIISFEPLSGPFSILNRRASADSLWDCRRYALGDFDGTIPINVAGNAGQSSSALPMLKSHQDVYPPANYIGVEDVPIHRLDSVVPEILRPDDATFLKVDVQGFEKQVLAGGKSTVGDRCVGLQLELSFLPLYEGGMLAREALELVHSLGFTLTGLLPCFTDFRNGRMLQADGIFFREDD
ncbi:FkbM family methyltransferase [Mycobacterium celatum]|uniref:FkbM family methyltransferase n=1 Tax=Mycobacterium celatum TaxID=28045 RepID=A0A1X1RU38_MYCCE|nr:FkbM family methyltransferase [Mycobacterium celatum]ORV16694.1 FkbM family methyltransferase [Mycobacterium celatum]PIB79313.1 FkbM family methyltransferase [Mycobacterium celatum]